MEEIIDNILLYLKGSGWDEELWQYFKSREFEKVIEFLQEQVKENKRFVPGIEQMFYWMKRIKFDTIKCVLFIEDPYNKLDRTGMPIMNKDEFTKTMNDGLGQFFDVKLNKYRTEFDEYNIDRWCDQGVLFFPYACTIRLEGKPHNQIWTDFRARVIDIINYRHKHIPWVLMNLTDTENGTHKYENLIESKYTFPMVLFPANTTWSKWVNECLRNKNIEPIDWIGKKRVDPRRVNDSKIIAEINKEEPVAAIEEVGMKTEKEETDESDFEMRKIKVKHLPIPFIQCDLDYKYIKTFESIGAISREFRIDKSWFSREINKGLCIIPHKKLEMYRFYKSDCIPEEFYAANPTNYKSEIQG